jgi:hypothetical protein
MATATPRAPSTPAVPRDGAALARPRELVDDSARREAKLIADLGKAIAAAAMHDALLSARGCLAVAEVLVGVADDPAARTVLALEAVRLALHLDPHVASVTWQ